MLICLPDSHTTAGKAATKRSPTAASCAAGCLLSLLLSGIGVIHKVVVVSSIAHAPLKSLHLGHCLRVEFYILSINDVCATGRVHA